MPRVDARVRAARLDEIPPERFFVRAPVRDSVFDPPGDAVVLDRIPVDRVQFADLRLFELLVHECELVECEFSGRIAETGTLGSFGSWLEPSRFGRSHYLRCTFGRCDLSTIDPGWTRFEDCTFEECRIKGWFTHNAEFVGCRFPNTSLEDTTFFGTTTYRAVAADPASRPNEFIGNDFTRAGLHGTDFRAGIDLSAQTWPEETEILSNLHDRIAWAKAQVETWKGERRRHGLFDLEMLEIPYVGQEDLLVQEEFHDPEILELLRRGLGG